MKKPASCHPDKPQKARGLCHNCYAREARQKASYRVRHIVRTYNTTPERASELLAQEQCAICGAPANDVDHNHRTQIIRGRLCRNCNNGLGHFKDSPRLLRGAASYLEEKDELVKRIGCDLDGVLADFVKSYNDLARHELGIDLPYPAPVWAWHREYGVTEAQEAQLLELMVKTPFHGSHLPLPGALDALERLNMLSNQGNDVYFISSRPGDLAKVWSEAWLKFHGVARPTVLIAEHKGLLAKGLRLHVFIEDKPENNQDVLQHSPSTRVYLIDHLYNRWAGADYGIRVRDVNDVLDKEFPREERRVA